MTVCSSKCSPIATWRADASAQSSSVSCSCGTFSLIPPHNPSCNNTTESASCKAEGNFMGFQLEHRARLEPSAFVITAVMWCVGAVRIHPRTRARSYCRFGLPFIHFIPDSLTYSAPLFLKRQCDRTLDGRQEQLRRGLLAPPAQRQRVAAGAGA